MKKVIYVILLVLLPMVLSAQGDLGVKAVATAELKLLDPLDETRGWCVDLFAHRKNALPIGGFQGHNCFMYMGDGPTEDQGFDVEKIKADGVFHLVYWDVCMTLHEPKSGSFIASEACDGSLSQQFNVEDDGRIIPRVSPELCLTLGNLSVPGGGRLAPVGTRPPKSNETIHLIRRLSFETCSVENAKLQQWGFRNEYAVEVPTEPNRFVKPD